MKKNKIIDRVFILFLCFLFFLPVGSTSFAAIDYSGGLLDGKTLKLTNSKDATVYSTATASTTKLTDNDESTFEPYTYSYAAYKFDSPVSISAVRSKTNGKTLDGSNYFLIKMVSC